MAAPATPVPGRGCAAEAERLIAVIAAINLAVQPDTIPDDTAPVTYTDSVVARVQARRRRIAASGLRLIKSTP